MTSYIAITDAETDPEAPLTSELAKKWRDNPIAIAEQDASVPNALRIGHWLLGTLNTTSGSTQTLSGLSLTPFRFLIFVWDDVSLATFSGSPTYRVGTGIVSPVVTTAVQTFVGTVTVSLDTGRVFGGVFDTAAGTTATLFVGDSGYSNASTSVSVSTSVGTFDAGTVKVYGVK